jgi:hypothetical protein
MVTIQNWDALLVALLVVEHDEAWLRGTTDPTVGGFSLAAARVQWETWQTRRSYYATFYGPGGWHRYFVYASGEVKFSAGHASRDATTRARAAGFGITGEAATQASENTEGRERNQLRDRLEQARERLEIVRVTFPPGVVYPGMAWAADALVLGTEIDPKGLLRARVLVEMGSRTDETAVPWFWLHI